MRNIILITTIITLSTFGLFAQGFGDRDKDQNRSRDLIHDKLGLTEEQEAKIEDLRFDHQKEMIELRAELEKKELELQELKSKGNYTRDEYVAMTEEIMKVRNRMGMTKANHQMDVYELLDPSQKKTWNDITKNFPRHKRDFRMHRKDHRFN